MRRMRGRLLVALLVGVALVLLSGLGALAADDDILIGFGSGTGGARPAISVGGRRAHGRPGPKPGAGAAASNAPAQAAVTLAPGATVAVPRSFLGISTEYWGLPLFERQMGVFERTLSLLRAPGDGPLLVRIGGDSADHSFWVPRSQPMPAWAFELTPAWLQQTNTLVRNLGLRLILDLNLVTDTPRAAAGWAQAAEAELPPGSITGFEIGNEPDIYDRGFWVATVSHSKVVPPTGLSPRTYAHDFQAYARALRRAAPGVPLLGPALALPSISRKWISTLLASGPAHPAVISVHRYPYSGCALPGTAAFATIGRVLSEHASAGVARSVEPALGMARRAGDPVRLTELNSVTCGGRPGVSDAFATALWAPDALFELLRAGVAGVNVHVRARAVNAAFALSARGLSAKPLLYGLITFVRMLGPGARFVPLTLHAAPALHLKAWAVRVSGGVLHVLLIDKGERSADVSLRLPGIGLATVERLLASSPSARSGVTLAGQYLGAGGAWEGRAVAETVRPGPIRRLLRGGSALQRRARHLPAAAGGAERLTRPRARAAVARGGAHAGRRRASAPAQPVAGSRAAAVGPLRLDAGAPAGALAGGRAGQSRPASAGAGAGSGSAMTPARSAVSVSAMTPGRSAVSVSPTTIAISAPATAGSN